MKVLFQLNHPAHYHLFRNTIQSLKNRGHQVYILAREKDILKDLLVTESYTMLNTPKGKTIVGKIAKMNVAKREVLEYVSKLSPDLVVGTGTFGYITSKLKIPTIFFAEDDVTLNIPIFLTATTCYPFFSEILSPIGCNNSIWNKKTTFYSGYQKLAYLHPNQFTPDKNIVNQYFSKEKPYFLLRFAELNAYHDINVKGINTEIAQKLIDLLAEHGNVYITSERELEPQFEKYRLNINPLDVHHIMAFSKLYIGDSQSMAVEATMLGVPSVRFNDFAGRISVLEELEHKYKLTFGIKTSEPDKLYNTVESLLNTPHLKETFQKRRQKMLNDKIDVSAFYTWFIENYPESAQIMKENPDYQYNFK